jgi:hypothetical protein
MLVFGEVTQNDALALTKLNQVGNLELRLF